MGSGDEQACKETVGRYFDGGAYRDTEDGKLDYARALCPHVLERYLQYLESTRLQSDGNMREFDNWKGGIPVKVYMSSMWRHVWSVWCYVFGMRKPEEEMEDALCAVIFNSMGMLHEVIKSRQHPGSINKV